MKTKGGKKVKEKYFVLLTFLYPGFAPTLPCKLARFWWERYIAIFNNFRRMKRKLNTAILKIQYTLIIIKAKIYIPKYGIWDFVS